MLCKIDTAIQTIEVSRAFPRDSSSEYDRLASDRDRTQTTCAQLNWSPRPKGSVIGIIVRLILTGCLQAVAMLTADTGNGAFNPIEANPFRSENQLKQYLG